MGERRRSWLVAALVLGVLAPATVPATVGAATAAPTTAAAASPPRCGARDLPETGVQGDVPLADQLSGRAEQGYNCGLALVGYSSLGARGGNANMAWSQDCAYVAGAGVAVVDVKDPTRPRLVRTLRTAGSDATVETLHAVDAGDRHLLATGRYGLFGVSGGSGTGPVDIWDVSSCTAPKLLSTIQFPSNVHNLTFSADGRRLWSTLPLQAADLSNPRRPRMLPPIEQQLADSGHFHFQYAHEAWPSPDDTRLYVGGQILFDDEELLVIDTTDWPRKPARVIGSIAEPGHSIRPARIGGKPYLINSDESILNPTAKGCLPNALTPFGGASTPFLTDLSNERLPKRRGEIRLGIEQPIHCTDQLLSGVNASVHYQDVDDPDDTTFAMVSAWNSGLRVWDVRDPANPHEVAYFNPGKVAGDPLGGSPGVGTFLRLTNLAGLDQAWAHTRYRPDTGQLWLTTASGGFWVLELEPQVRRALDLPSRPVHHPKGAIPRPAPTRISVGATSASLLATYCAINVARSL